MPLVGFSAHVNYIVLIASCRISNLSLTSDLSETITHVVKKYRVAEVNRAIEVSENDITVAAQVLQKLRFKS